MSIRPYAAFDSITVLVARRNGHDFHILRKGDSRFPPRRHTVDFERLFRGHDSFERVAEGASIRWGRLERVSAHTEATENAVTTVLRCCQGLRCRHDRGRITVDPETVQ